MNEFSITVEYYHYLGKINLQDLDSIVVYGSVASGSSAYTIYTTEYDWSDPANPPAYPSADDATAIGSGVINAQWNDKNKYTNPHDTSLNEAFTATEEEQNVFIRTAGGVQTKLDYIVITCSNDNNM